MTLPSGTGSRSGAVSGDSVADWLLTKAAEELADTVEAGPPPGMPRSTGVRVSFSGGVFRSQTLSGRFRADIEQQYKRRCA